MIFRIMQLEWREQGTGFIAHNLLGYFTVNPLFDYQWSFGFAAHKDDIPICISGIVTEEEAKRYAQNLYEEKMRKLLTEITCQELATAAGIKVKSAAAILKNLEK